MYNGEDVVGVVKIQCRISLHADMTGVSAAVLIDMYIPCVVWCVYTCIGIPLNGQ